jgi:cytochrome c oxidase subunit IV
MSKVAEAHDWDQPHEPDYSGYVKIAGVLFVMIALELVTYYLAPSGWIIPLLGIFAAIKFFVIGAWFMHLRFDSNIFRLLFLGGLTLAVSIFFVTLMIFLFATPFSPIGS